MQLCLTLGSSVNRSVNQEHVSQIHPAYYHPLLIMSPAIAIPGITTISGQVNMNLQFFTFLKNVVSGQVKPAEPKSEINLRHR